MLLLVSLSSLPSSASASLAQLAEPPAALHALPFGLGAVPENAAALTAPAAAVRVALTSGQRAEMLARRRVLLIERARALGLASSSRPSSPTGESVDGFAPIPRQSLAQIERCPLLSRAERQRVRLEVELSRDAELWAVGRGSPCMWLAVLS